MTRKLTFFALLLTTLTPFAAPAKGVATYKSVKVTLPVSNAMFAPGPDSDAINNDCLACHSAEMILVQPALPRATWQAEVDKMRGVYKAPIEDNDAQAIVDYLVRTKGAEESR